MPNLSPLASVSATREVLVRHGLATKKNLGQHFLINDGIVKRICDAAEVSDDDTVLEVGPGIGTLTIALLKKARQVVAIEKDADLLAVLADTCGEYAESFSLIQGDALKLVEGDLKKAHLTKLFSGEEPPNKFISNLPYAVAATLILDYFERLTSLSSATLMVQSEVADRICAKPGTKAYGAYTVKLSLYAEVKNRFTVGPQNFFPPPRVDSAVIRLDRVSVLDSEQNSLDQKTIQAASLMADAAFANRRKTILNSSKTYFSLLGEQGIALFEHASHILEEAGIDARVRGETLSREQYIALGQAAAQFINEESQS